MNGIQNFGRYTGDLRKCCTHNNDHWYFEVDMMNTRCGCGNPFSGGKDACRYIFCSIHRKLMWIFLGDNYLYGSCHTKCAQNGLSIRCNQAIIKEIRELYDKLRIIADFINEDCIRYITLCQLSYGLIKIEKPFEAGDDIL